MVILHTGDTQRTMQCQVTSNRNMLIASQVYINSSEAARAQAPT